MTKRKRRRLQFRDLAFEYVSIRGYAELSDIVRYIQGKSSFGVERCSLGVILGTEPRLERERLIVNGTYVTIYKLP